MAESIHMHMDDNGTLSVFVEGDAVLISCEHGHGWLIDAQPVASKEQAAGVLGDRIGAAALESMTKLLSG